MLLLTDQTGRRVELQNPAQRIVSVVPSQTELLYDLSLDQRVVGITKFCVHPASWHQTKTRIGGTKTLNIERIKSLRPDLVLAAKEENVKEQIDELAARFPVWISDVKNLDDALAMMEAVGALTAADKEAETLSQRIRSGFRELAKAERKPRACYLIWKEPYMTTGGDTFINDMLNKAGFDNAFAYQQRYPMITVEEIQAAGCDFLFLSSEPYPFKQNDVDEWQSRLPQTKVALVDGEMFSWYGSRLQYAPAYFKSLQAQLQQNH